MSEFIKETLENGVLHLRFDRVEKKNAITNEMYAALAAGFAKAATEEEIRAVMLEGSDEIFTAGNDLAAFAAWPEVDSDEKPPVWEFIENVATCPVPVVAAVSGLAIGIGSTILLHCDLVYADDSAVFHMPFTDLAAVPEAGASYILPRRFGRQIAAEFLLLADKVSARRAYDMGFVNEVIQGDVRLHAKLAAERLADKPPHALQKSKELMYGGQDELLTHIPVELKEFGACLRSEEMQKVIMKMMMKKG